MYLDTSSLNLIHNASMELLVKKGIVFHVGECCEIAQKHGCTVDGNTVFFTEEKLMKLVQQVPAKFNVSGPNPDKAVIVGDNTINYIPSGGPQWYLDEDDNFRDAEIRDYVYLNKMFACAPEINIMAGRVIQPNDVKPEDIVGHLLFHLHQITDKPFMLSCYGERNTRMMLEMFKILYGGEKEYMKLPRFLAAACVLSPMQFDDNACGLLLRLPPKGQPVIVTSQAMAGTTAPITMSGMLAQSNAEILAGIAMGQMTGPGAPMVYGMLSTMADMKTGNIATGSPEQAMITLLGGAMSRYYSLPCRVGSGAMTDAAGPGFQAGYEGMMNIIAGVLANTHLSFHAAGGLCAMNIASPLKAMGDLEMIGMSKRLFGGINLSPKHLALDVIEEVAPNGTFMTHDHTMEFFRSEPFHPHVSARLSKSHPSWAEDEKSRLKAEAKRRFEAFKAPDIPPGLVKDMKAYLAAEGIDPKIP